jgi:Flp pilus assembly protein TadG
MKMRLPAHTGILRPIRRFRRDNRAVSAVEFAILMPLMVTIFLGGTEITQGITIKRKTTIATRTLADLVAQDINITNAEMTAIFAATTAVISPYPSNAFYMIVSSVMIDADGNAKILWSSASSGDSPHAVNDPVTLPPGLNAYPNTSLIWAEAKFTYTPMVGYLITGSMDLNDRVYLRPRLVNFVTRSAT